MPNTTHRFDQESALQPLSAERAAHEQRAQFALAATRDGVWDWDIASGHVHFSAQWARLLGYEPAEVPHRVEFFFTVLHPDDVQRVTAVLEAHLAGRTPIKQDEIRLRTKAGAYRWFFDRGEVVVRDAGGRPLRMVGTITDITERKQAEARQLVQRDVLESIASGAPLHASLGLLARSLDAVSDDTLCSILLLDDDGRRLHTLAAPSLPDDYSRAIDGLRIGPTAGSCGSAAFRREPVIVEDIATDPLWADFRALALPHGLRACWSTPIMDAHGSVLGTFAVYAQTPSRPSAHHLQLITLATHVAALAITKHRSERALRESEERNRLLIRAADVGLWDWNLVTNEVYFSPEWTQQLGYAEDELPNRFEEWESRLHPEDREATLGAVRDFREGRRPVYDMEFRLRHKDGSWRWLFSRADFTRDAAGEPVRMMGCHVDITARKEGEAVRASLESQLFEAHKMQAIGTLAGGIAHDFNNILASILVNVTLAQQDVHAGRPAQGSLELIAKSSLRARDLVQQILAFSRREPHELVNQPVRPLVAEVLDLLRSTLPAGVRLDAALSDEPLHACVAASQLQQALINLCTNAWQAMRGPGGRITVGLGAVRLGAAEVQGLGLSAGGDFVHLCVSDSGQGMDAATRARIFEPFFTTKARGQGTGLGLSVVHGVMVGHGGAVAVDSTPGHGSVFHLYFPAAAAPAIVERAQPVEESPAPSGHGQHVLYVDDDEMVVGVVRRLLRLSGYQATCLTSGAQALEVLGADPAAFDLVIADFNMPDLSGLDIAREVALTRPGLPVVISSGYISDDLLLQAPGAGVRALLDKQNTFAEMIPLVRRLLAGVAGRPSR